MGKKDKKVSKFVEKLSTIKSATFRGMGTYARSYTHYPQKNRVKISRFYGNYKNKCFVYKS